MKKRENHDENESLSLAELKCLIWARGQSDALLTVFWNGNMLPTLGGWRVLTGEKRDASNGAGRGYGFLSGQA
jgi:hypothetical protein